MCYNPHLPSSLFYKYDIITGLGLLLRSTCHLHQHHQSMVANSLTPPPLPFDTTTPHLDIHDTSLVARRIIFLYETSCNITIYFFVKKQRFTISQSAITGYFAAAIACIAYLITYSYSYCFSSRTSMFNVFFLVRSF